MVYSRDKYAYCGNSRTCRTQTKWVRCPRCAGKGSSTWATCNNKCDSGYKCEKGVTDPYH